MGDLAMIIKTKAQPGKRDEGKPFPGLQRQASRTGGQFRHPRPHLRDACAQIRPRVQVERAVSDGNVLFGGRRPRQADGGRAQ